MSKRITSALLGLCFAGALGVAACSSAEGPTLVDQSDVETTTIAPNQSTETETEPEADEQRFPDVVEVNVEREGQGPYTFDVTISSPYDSPERYADAWRVVGIDGTVYGTRVLDHDHQGEQPFTRSLAGVEIPADVTQVLVEGRDLQNGWGGGTADIRLDSGS